MKEDNPSLDDLPTFVSSKKNFAPSGNYSGESSDQQIGNYRVVSILGEGGMGTVYLGLQEKPVERKVAIKVIRQRVPDPDILARFHCERQAVASLRHRNIANLLEVGGTDDGRPFFAMELIEGEAITDFCDRHQLSINERLELITQACDALAHAHHKGLIHRDIKPSNLLVERENDQNQLKIIDFGLAKFLEDSSVEQVKTFAGQILGTPQYMSPEQAQGSESDIRSDVFSIGVILYELLTGTTPLSNETNGGIQKILSELGEFQAIKPSTKVASTTKLTISKARNDVASNRSSNSSGLYHTLKGDLDWITLKALEKEQDHRYRSCNELSDDIRRYLNQEPILARPPSFPYLAKKFVKRNRLAVSLVSVVLLFLSSALIAGWFFAIWAMNQAEQEKKTARRINATNLELELALKKLTATSKRALDAEKRSDTALGFLTSSFEGLDSSVTGRDLSASDAVWLAYQNSKDDHSMDVAGHIKFRITLADALNGLGRNKKAMLVIEDALKLAEEEEEKKISVEIFLVGRKVLHQILLDQDQVDRLRNELENSNKLLIKHGMVGSYFDQIFQLQHGLSNFAMGNPIEISATIPLFEKALSKLNEMKHPFTQEIQSYRSRLAYACMQIHSAEKGRQILESVLKFQKANLAENHPSIILTQIRLSENIAINERISPQLQKIQDSISKLELIYHENHPDVLFIYREYLRLCNADRRPDQVVETIKKVLPRFEKSYGFNHERTADILQELAKALLSQGEPVRAIETQKRVIEIKQSDSNVGTLSIAQSMLELAKIYYRAREYEDAINTSENLLKLSEKNHLTLVTSESLTCLSLSYLNSGKPRKSLKAAKRLMAYRLKFCPSDNFSVGKAHYCLAVTYFVIKNYSLAKENFQSAINLLREAYSYKKNSRVGRALSDCQFRMAQIWLRSGKLKQCEKLFTSALQIQKEVITQDRPIVRYDDRSLYLKIFLWGKTVRFKNHEFCRNIDFQKEYEFIWNIQIESKELRSATTVSIADGYYQELLFQRKFSKALKVCEVATSVFDGLPATEKDDSGLFLAKFMFLERQATVHHYLGSVKNQKQFLGKALEEMRRVVLQYKTPKRRKIIQSIFQYCKEGKKIWIDDYRKTLLKLERELTSAK